MKLEQRLLSEIKNGRLFKTQAEIMRTPPFYAHTKQSKKTIRTALKELENDGKICRDNKGRYCTPEQLGVFEGTLKGNERGFAFVIPADKQRFAGDFFIPKSSVNGALDGDKVLAAPVRGTKDEAFIIKVIERGRKKLVGVYERGIFYPDDTSMPEVIIPRNLSMNAKDGDKILCEITAYRQSGAPTGKAVEVLGESGDFEVEELSIIRAHGLYEQFPDEVTEEAQDVSREPVLPDGRRDLRDKLIFTIDGADTRDIDDGVSLEIVNGNYVLGVHIADVSRYVKYKSKLDREAYARGTSVYFPDRVLPMLPKELSNGACSLNEGEDRYSLSCIMTFDRDGKRTDYEICESVICSRHKMTYPDVTAICNGDKDVCEKYADIVSTVKDMEKLCLIMEGNRKAAGGIDLDLREAKIYIDGDGEIVIPDYERGISERIIEQFMIAANEAVAEFLLKNSAPCLYRVHESPSPEKAGTLISFLKDLGINARCNADSVKPKDFQNILSQTADKPYSSVVSKVMLRSMQKARYCENNLGHFGLASSCYCHFTSPIRRYPDLFVHRAVKAVIHKRSGSLEKYAKNAQIAGIECSERERIADEAERDVDDLYKAVYMSDRIGETYEATVSGVTNFGVFCELDNTIEGLIPVEILPDEYYEFVPEKFLLKGKKRSFRLGDRLRIRVDGCDFGRMRVMFALDG